jgi:hypothetical protein
MLKRKKILVTQPNYSHRIKPSGIQAAYDGLRDQLA